jgi:hypothetical protein
VVDHALIAALCSEEGDEGGCTQPSISVTNQSHHHLVG